MISTQRLPSDTESLPPQVDHWLTVSSGPLGCKGDLSEVLSQLDAALAPSTFLAAGKLTVADLELFSALYSE